LSAYIAGDTWGALVRAAETHESQFTPAQVENPRHTPAAQRVVWFRLTKIGG
jgi:hypothetical protein